MRLLILILCLFFSSFCYSLNVGCAVPLNPVSDVDRSCQIKADVIALRNEPGVTFFPKGSGPVASYCYWCTDTLPCKDGTIQIGHQCKCPDGSDPDANNKCPTSSAPASSSSQSSSVKSCPSGQFLDGNNQCNKACVAPQVYSPIIDGCEAKKTCEYPQLYSMNFNSCSNNPHMCAQRATWDVINERCVSYDDSASCPSGWAMTINFTCIETGSNSGSSSGANNSQANTSQANASSGQQASSRASVGSGPQDPKPPVSPGDNTSPTQPTTGSQSIPPGISNTDCLSQFSAQACDAIQKCQQTFGSNNCAGITTGQPCPNTYTVNGQRICVNQTSGSNSGTGTSSGNQSSQAGQCDPTAKSYDECMGRNRTPSLSDTQSIIDALNNKNQQSLDDYQKSRTDDIKQQAESGISFANAPNQFRTFLSSYVPTSSTCVPVSIDIKDIHAKIDCSIFALIKTGFAWFFSLMAVLYIWSIAMRPAPEQSS